MSSLEVGATNKSRARTEVNKEDYEKLYSEYHKGSAQET
jgi:hypothetical protein